jgi:hypothetical protein
VQGQGKRLHQRGSYPHAFGAVELDLLALSFRIQFDMRRQFLAQQNVERDSRAFATR